MASEPLIVEAIFAFKASNNDELCFKKGDLITVTQKDEGWWEGTLNGKTGWFPSNYVKESKDTPKPPPHPEQPQYKSVVLKDLIDSEKAHVTELGNLVGNFLQPLEKSSILSEDEYKQLTGNLTEVLDVHQQLLSLVEAEEQKSGPEQKVGKLFLTWAPKIKGVFQVYCSLHPKAVVILDRFRDELTKYMEGRGAASPGVLVLTTLLSKPFRRLDKYAGMLQELERHIEESHPDRGDIQRSVAIYKEIASTCSAIRRQKELELQVLAGPVRGWEGPNLSTLGDIIYMGSVAVGPQHNDRYFVLFPQTLLILSVSHRLSAFIYEGKLPLSGLVVVKLDDNEQYKNAFEISGPMIEKKIAVCQSRNEALHWVELLRKQMPKPVNLSQKCQAQFVPQPPPHTSALVAASKAPRPATNSQSMSGGNRGWSITNLRPIPPLQPCLALGTCTNGGRSNRKPISYKDDRLILDVIESYCNVARPRNAVNSAEFTGNLPKMESNKNFVEALQVLESKLNILEYNVSTISLQLVEEKNCRCTLQNIVKNYLLSNSKEFDNNVDKVMESNV